MNRAVVYPNEEHCWLIDIEPFFLDQTSSPVLDNQIGMDSERLTVLFQISQKGNFWNAVLKPVTEQQWHTHTHTYTHTHKKSFSFANIVSALKWSSVAQHRATCWRPYPGPEPGSMEINGKTPAHFNGVQSNCLVLSQAQFPLISMGFLHTPGGQLFCWCKSASPPWLVMEFCWSLPDTDLAQGLCKNWMRVQGHSLYILVRVFA